MRPQIRKPDQSAYDPIHEFRAARGKDTIGDIRQECVIACEDGMMNCVLPLL